MSIEDIENRANAATPGPWQATSIHDFAHTGKMVSDVIRNPLRKPDETFKGFFVNEPNSEADAEFIAHARTDVPEIAKVVRAAIALKRDLHLNAHINKNMKITWEILERWHAFVNLEETLKDLL